MSIKRALASIGWSEKTLCRIAKQRNADLRDLYCYTLLGFRSYRLVYVDGIVDKSLSNTALHALV